MKALAQPALIIIVYLFPHVYRSCSLAGWLCTFEWIVCLFTLRPLCSGIPMSCRRPWRRVLHHSVVPAHGRWVVWWVKKRFGVHQLPDWHHDAFESCNVWAQNWQSIQSPTGLQCWYRHTTFGALMDRNRRYPFCLKKNVHLILYFKYSNSFRPKKNVHLIFWGVFLKKTILDL
jgi:hypothetical protein